MPESSTVMVALSGGVDSAVAALLLKSSGYRVQCLHMTNWEDDGYCDSAADYRDARRICESLELPLHRVNFTAEYRTRVFARFLEQLRRGLTPNPDVLCNREIKFGVLKHYARRLGATALATGHYARLERRGGQTALLKAKDQGKDQSYFLHAVAEQELADVLFPLGAYDKAEVRDMARQAGLHVAEKKDSTGICFIGERPFAEFLRRYLPTEPGEIRTLDGEVLGKHAGLAYYTLGQRQGLSVGGVRHRPQLPWFVAAKDRQSNVLVVVQGGNHPALYSDRLLASDVRFIGEPPRAFAAGASFACAAKTRYRQRDQACLVTPLSRGRFAVAFETPQRAVTPGQFVVLYDGERCLGGGTIDRIENAPGQRAAL